jgi:hypothetical protein
MITLLKRRAYWQIPTKEQTYEDVFKTSIIDDSGHVF